MLDCVNTYFNLEQIAVMCFAIGFNPEGLQGGQSVFRYRRNYFSCASPTPAWEDLCKHGLAVVESRSSCDSRICYKVNENGIKVLSYIYRIEFEEVRR